MSSTAYSKGLSTLSSCNSRKFAGTSLRVIGARRSFFVMADVTRSPLPRRLYASDILLRPSFSSSFIRHASSSTATKRDSDMLHGIDTEVNETDHSFNSSEPDAALKFSSLSDYLHPDTLKAIKHTHMSPVQAQILPMLPELALGHDHVFHKSEGEAFGVHNHFRNADKPESKENVRDLLVKAKTGTGKTMAFLVPAIESRLAALSSNTASLYAEAASNGTKLTSNDILIATSHFAKSNVGTLIISPTRELATQISVEAQNLTAHHKGFQVQVLLGGESKGRQCREWFTGRKDIVVATPGRLIDLIENEKGFKDALKGTRTFVLDEADTLLDMGFRDDIERITSHLPPSPHRQTFLFSATVSRAIQSIARSTLSEDHKFVNCVSEDDSPVHAHIPQYHTVLKTADEIIPHVLRLIALDQLEHAPKDSKDLTKGNKSKIVIFLSTTNMVQLFSQVIRRSLDVLPCGSPKNGGTSVFEMHAKLDMSQRMRVSAGFKGDKTMLHHAKYGRDPRDKNKGGRKWGASEVVETPYASILITSDVSARGVDYPGVTRVIQVGAPSSSDIYIHRVGRTGRGNSKTGRGDLVLMPFEMAFVRKKLTGELGVGIQPVTAADVEKELEAKVAEMEERGVIGKNREVYNKVAISEIPTRAREVTQQLGMEGSSFDRDDDRVGSAYASQIGFFLGKANTLGLDIRDVINGLKTMWVEMWGLQREPSLSRNLREMVESAVNSRDWRGDSGRGRDNRRSGGGWSSGGRDSNRGSGSYGQGNRGTSSYGQGNRGTNSSGQGNRWEGRGNVSRNSGSKAVDSWLSSPTSSSSSPYKGSRRSSTPFDEGQPGAPRGFDGGYGYAKGSRAGVGYASTFGKRKESQWEDGGRSRWSNDRRGRNNSWSDVD